MLDEWAGVSSPKAVQIPPQVWGPVRELHWEKQTPNLCLRQQRLALLVFVLLEGMPWQTSFCVWHFSFSLICGSDKVERQTDIEKKFPCAGSLSKCRQPPGLGPLQAGIWKRSYSEGLPCGLWGPKGLVLHLLPRKICSSRKPESAAQPGLKPKL